MDNYLALLQKKELEILDFVVAFCEEEKINYFLTDGTLLGAVRHQGFIPWDDDVDLGMSRKDYQRFVETFPKYIEGTKYALESTQTDSNCVLTFAKVHDTQTKLVQSMVQEANNYQHIFIDIFPFDEEPDNKFQAYLQWGQTRLLSFLLNVRAKIARESAKRFPLNLLYKLLELRYHGKSNQEIIEKRDGITQRYNGQKMTNCSNIVLSKPTQCVVKRTEINQTKFVPFGEKSYRVPQDPAYYLSSYYGDFMKLPPVEERKNVHSLVYLEIDGQVFDKAFFQKSGEANG